ncbi:MAG: hypothetical protein MZV65_45015 [Chromatiales bacterium]|nr:hypothetical protein [Chromatiales bacterium]
MKKYVLYTVAVALSCFLHSAVLPEAMQFLIKLRLHSANTTINEIAKVVATYKLRFGELPLSEDRKALIGFVRGDYASRPKKAEFLTDN